MNSIQHVPFARRLRPAPVGGGLSLPGYWCWCGSTVRGEDGRYHLFAARWPQEMKFLPGYQSYSEIIRAVADTPTGPYTFQEVVLGDRGSEFWDGRMTHNPVVLKQGDIYWLFYIGTTFNGPKPTAAELAAGPDMWPWYRQISIGVASSRSVLGPWKRPDRPFLLPRPGQWDQHVVTNPAPCLSRDGRLLLYYRTWIPQVGCRLGLAIFDDLEGPCRWRSEQPLFEAPGLSLEDPCVFELDDHFEMIAKDLTGSVAGELHAGVHLLSKDGRQWEFAPRAKAYSRDLAWDDGQVRQLGCFERPQVLIENGQPRCLLAAMAEGPTGKPGNFGNLVRTWTGVVPLAL